MLGQALANGGKSSPNNTRGISAVLFGDSITAQHSGGSAGSRNASMSMRGYFNWVQFKLKHPFYCPMGYDGNLVFNTGIVSGTGRPVGIMRGSAAINCLGC